MVVVEWLYSPCAISCSARPFLKPLAFLILARLFWNQIFDLRLVEAQLLRQRLPPLLRDVAVGLELALQPLQLLRRPRTSEIEKRRRTEKEDKRRADGASTAEQLQRLKSEFQANRYITEQRRQSLAAGAEASTSLRIKIWFPEQSGPRSRRPAALKNGLALQLMAQGL
ncbi:hypothetical protein CRUP_022471 [Coryphaenoides rupestris]|nr:hypothetical protein CRUP_022471 [Coryphaenoides rupestris]